jgi:hypothetical protein
MSSEWMKVMLDEIARKQAEGALERLELERRRGDAAHEGGTRPDGTHDDATRGDGTPGARASG